MADSDAAVGRRDSQLTSLQVNRKSHLPSKRLIVERQYRNVQSSEFTCYPAHSSVHCVLGQYVASS